MLYRKPPLQKELFWSDALCYAEGNPPADTLIRPYTVEETVLKNPHRSIINRVRAEPALHY